STTEQIDVNSDAVDEVVCLSDDGNPTTPTQADGSEIAAAMKTRGIPKKGMTFDSLEALEKFYSSYRKACGFGVIRVGAKKDGNTNVKRWQYWHCECGPRTSINQVVKEGDPKGAEVQPCKRRRKSKKCGCEAGIAGYLNKDGLWEIHKVELTHKNHVPTPSKSRFIPSYRDVPKFVLRVAKDLMDAGVKQRKKKIKSTLMVERFFQKIYTDAKFKEVQTECLALIYVLPGTEVQLSETVTEYTLVERIQVGDPIRHVTRGLKVTVDMEKLEFTCSCRMFEHKGILCRHCIRAMEMTNIATVPDNFDLERGLKMAKMILSLARKVQMMLHKQITMSNKMLGMVLKIHHPENELEGHQVKPRRDSPSKRKAKVQRGLKVLQKGALQNLLYRGFQGSSTAISSAASSEFRPLHPGSFTNWWTYGVGGTSATGSSSPFAPPLPQFGSGSTTMHGVSTASNGQPTLLPQLHPRAVTSFLPPRPC
ncbi:Protein FAR1-RELATED SEQUENCE 11, partial [Bienertia sinuspersici]